MDTNMDGTISRRCLLRNTAAGFGHLALLSLLAEESGAASLNRKSEIANRKSPDPLAPKPPHFPPRAKSVIFLFMKGGPSHVDTFDPKPLLDRDHGKPFPGQKPRVQFAPTGNLLKSPWQFKQYGQSGIPVSELFPHVARHVDDLCILNS